MRLFVFPLFLLAAIPFSFAVMNGGVTNTFSAPGMRVNRVFLYQVSPYEAAPGDLVTLTGSGFSTASNTILFGSKVSTSATSTNGTTMVVRVPNNLKEGDYTVSVANTLGVSTAAGLEIPVKITNNPRQGPIITSASNVNGVVTVTGSGFADANNLYTTFGTLTGVLSSDGKSLTFRISSLSEYVNVKNILYGRSSVLAPLWISIQNEYGVTASPYKIDIIL